MKTAEHIIETVDKLVRKYHTRDPYELCQLLGIKIHYYDLQKKLKGFFYYQSRQKNIVIDHNVNGILERILVAHELGHAVLHTKIATEETGPWYLTYDQADVLDTAVIYSLSIDDETGDIYIATTGHSNNNGDVYRFRADGRFVESFDCGGQNPNSIIFVD